MIKFKIWKFTIIAMWLWGSLWGAIPIGMAYANEDIKTYLSAEIAMKRLEIDKANELFDKLINHRNFKKISKQRQQDIASKAAIAYFMAGDYGKAMKLKKYHDSYGLPHMLLSLQAIKKEKWKTALRSLKIIKNTDDMNAGQRWMKNWGVPLIKVWALAGQGKAGQAFSHFDEIAKPPSFANAFHLQEILLHLHLRQPQAVLLKLGNPYNLSSDFLVYYLQALAMLNHKEEIYKILENRQERDNEVFAELLQALENNIDIEAVLTSPNQAISLFSAYFAQTLSSHLQTALFHARLAVFTGDDNFDFVNMIAKAFAESGDYNTAIKVWQDFTPEKDNQRILSVLYIAEYLSRLKKYDAAEDLLLELRREFPKDISLREALASMYLRQGLNASVIEFYDGEVLLAADKSHWRSFYLRGIAYEKLDMWDKAERDLLVAYELVPNDADVLNHLGYSWVIRGQNLQEAFELLKRAVELRNDDGAIMDSLGWAYYHLGDYDASVIYLERAVALSPQVSEILDHLGDAYWQVGRKLEAGFQWNRALGSDDITDELRSLILHKLEGVD